MKVFGCYVIAFVAVTAATTWMGVAAYNYEFHQALDQAWRIAAPSALVPVLLLVRNRT